VFTERGEKGGGARVLGSPLGNVSETAISCFQCSPKDSKAGGIRRGYRLHEWELVREETLQIEFCVHSERKREKNNNEGMRKNYIWSYRCPATPVNTGPRGERVFDAVRQKRKTFLIGRIDEQNGGRFD